MSIRTLFPNLNLLSARALPSSARCSPLPRLAFRQAHTSAISITRSTPKSGFQSGFKSYRSLYTTASIGLGLSFLTYHSNRSPVLCESAALPRPTASGPAAGQAPESMLNVYQLTFGTVCGICTGVFLKKGLRAIAFLLGGVFVLMQVSTSLDCHQRHIKLYRRSMDPFIRTLTLTLP